MTRLGFPSEYPAVGLSVSEWTWNGSCLSKWNIGDRENLPVNTPMWPCLAIVHILCNLHIC